MRTTFKSLLSFSILMALSGMVEARQQGIEASQPATNSEVGSWSCESETIGRYLVSINGGGVFTASPDVISNSVIHGAWQHTEPNTFSSKGLGFIYGPDGIADHIQIIDAISTVSDNDNLTMNLDITVTLLDGEVIETEAATAVCTRIQVGRDER
jgi:hypothetical protein